MMLQKQIQASVTTTRALNGAFGYQSILNNTTVIRNVVSGSTALADDVTDSVNVATGYTAIYCLYLLSQQLQFFIHLYHS